MIENNPLIEPIFKAALSKKAMKDGEITHKKMEELRKIAMSAGLTNSSQELEMICTNHSKEALNALKFGLESYDHYQNLLLLLENPIARIYAVAASNPTLDRKMKNDNLDERAINILSTKENEAKH